MSATGTLPAGPQDAEAAAERPARSHAGQLALMLLLAFAAACGHVQMGDSDLKPFWRRPGPALIEPQERRVLQDDGYVAQRGTLEGPVLAQRVAPEGPVLARRVTPELRGIG